jgi:hypothetical protein
MCKRPTKHARLLSRQPFDRIYAATQSGLLKSEDGGKSWQDAYWLRNPATMMHVTPDGAVYTFVVGTGLIQTVEPKLSWQTVNRGGFEWRVCPAPCCRSLEPPLLWSGPLGPDRSGARD